MSKKINLGVEKDHIESLTRANGITALTELLWNSLDADSTLVEVEYSKNKLGSIEEITIKDDGVGIDYQKAQRVFGALGGSDKKSSNISPGGRYYHGKEGKGRYKALALGDLVTFTSIYKDGEKFKTFNIVLDRNHLSYSDLGDVKPLPKGEHKTGFKVLIQNINDENSSYALNSKNRKEIEQKFASYWINYPDFTISFNGNKLEFESLIKNTDSTDLLIEDGELSYRFVLKVIEWSFDIPKKTYLCNTKGVPFKEINLGIRSTIPISIFIQSIYIEKLHRENRIDIQDLDSMIQDAYNEAKKFARSYVRDRLHHYSGEFIRNLKSKGLYPYKDNAEGVVEHSKRQVFDIVALQVNEYLPDFENQDDKTKKFTLSLIKEALEKDSSSLRKILAEVIELPEEKRDELVEILEDTSLSGIIDTMTEIKNRLRFLNGLEELIYNSELNKNVLERKHLHKIIVNETWLFGDEYAYGVDDVTLKNVLQAYIKNLGRDDFEEVVNQEPNDDLQIIPDVCLWKQFPQGSPGHKTNLVIELKKPRVDAGVNELGQIKLYASRVSKDRRFPKEKTKWKFLLVTKDVKADIEYELEQIDRKYGHVTSTDLVDVHVLTWGHIINEARTRYEYIQEKLNINLMDNNKNLDYLRTKYNEYLPEDLTVSLSSN
ncbi:ATP-binding protein [Christiangramia portivictoriae]|uniref:ATP-binding protein n=1 Tax=Christiangramia portivictoriae TaxID=326069 RepID=UPI000426238D|nr:ATP-binding protein [Christiangramia portivictoriae]